MTRTQALGLAIRERRAAAEQYLLNRALRHDKGLLDRAITAIVMTKVPDVSADPPKQGTSDPSID